MTDLPSMDEFEAEMRAWQQREAVDIRLSPMEVWVLFSQLQLALRHPKNVGPTAQIATVIAHRLQELLPDTPAMRMVAAAGWDPSCDDAEI